ncbi:hypothetical protein EXIGLDRAFT_649755 [Exidia glandulosa HHB12029]|uniref:Uncharacterized protein n=1 Tax=Exidia glandulosa HHB12029 TaxID=1314781 RepID=A0A166AA80_EXIGL|nr:hypothetical protein EXIGLDRAFT_649755 [Exidia glandulosa HHB12029]
MHIASRDGTSRSIQVLERRKGGGGHGSAEGGGSTGGVSEGGAGVGEGGGSGGGSGTGVVGHGSSVTEGQSTDAPGSFPVSGVRSSSSGSHLSAIPAGPGDSKVSVIPAGQPFAGQNQGGGTRALVVGSQTYGSGYAGSAQSVRGVDPSRGFPFYFWPVVWFHPVHHTPTYLYASQYGSASNSSRPGGPQQQLRLQTAIVGGTPANATTFHLIADSSTIKALIPKITSDCTGPGKLQTPLSTPTAYTGTSLSDPQPEQAVLYFRGSTVVLTNDGFNNTAALNDTQGNETVYKPTDAAAPLYTCLQTSIAKNVPLIQNVPNPSTSTSTAFAASTPSTIVLWTLFMFLLSMT